jgi:hypothetical protein
MEAFDLLSDSMSALPARVEGEFACFASCLREDLLPLWRFTEAG